MGIRVLRTLLPPMGCYRVLLVEDHADTARSSLTRVVLHFPELCGTLRVFQI